MLPVISFEINYKKPAHYDELLTIKTIIKEVPRVKFNFEFEIRNNVGVLLSTAKSTVVFMDSNSRYPMGVPDFVKQALKQRMEECKIT
jgi:acyl-CoA thioester hydrolase